MKLRVKILPYFFILFALVSCASFRNDTVLFSAGEAANQYIAELEKLIVPLDAGFSQADLRQIRIRIGEIEAMEITDTVFDARLQAWSGRLYIFEGKNSEASRRLKHAEELLPSDVQVTILKARLEPSAEKRLSLISSALSLENTSGELEIERARACVALKRYSEAVAAFDTAFVLLPSFYAETYRPERNTAWDLREIDSGVRDRTAILAVASSLRWLDAIELADAETNLFQFITGGKKWTPAQLFSRLAEQNIIPPEFRAADTVKRAGSAWFFWHLVAITNSNPSLLTRYSDRFGARPNAVSPVPDVPIGSAYFDSVLGCVEWEIMTLPDGKNFNPDETVKGSAFLQMLKKVN
ncbi:hypothetical protein K7I13_05435 [Brucepastera parasyntrophica]|uniref:hypothetical protein n=1 Tax=Brucepastera parasyntrophica TaxID=2880008 RepID=UPI00210C6F42|nr:hypothetical protein [Brucepastera parasyntrophica]ULQ60714.1 hypothetical protein K7I13_05435 [Brucepastera parasyntrophica]